MSYQIVNTLSNGQVITHLVDGVLRSIPFDPANSDYQAYLKFLADGGQPLPADGDK